MPGEKSIESITLEARTQCDQAAFGPKSHTHAGTQALDGEGGYVGSPANVEPPIPG